MSLDINTQKWVAYRLPGCEIKGSRVCGSATVYLFQRTMDNLRGIIIRGTDVNSRKIDQGIQELVQKYGSINIIFDSERFYVQAYRYLAQPGTEAKSLNGRTIRPQLVETQPSRAEPTPNHLPQVDMAYPVAVTRAFSFRKQIIHSEITNNGLVNHGLRTELKSFKIPEFKGSDKLKYSGPLTPFINCGSLEEFDKLFPGLRKNYRRSDFENGHNYEKQGTWGHYLIHKKTGVIIYDYGYEGGKHDGHNDFDVIKNIAKTLEEREELNKKLIDAERQIFQGQLMTGIYLDHIPWSQSISYLENLAINLGSHKAFTLLRQANYGNSLIMNVRLLSLHCSQLLEIRKTAGLLNALTSAGALSAIHPLIAGISIASSIVAMATSSGEKVLPPLTQKLFLEAVNNHILPMIEDMHKTLSDGQNALSKKMDEQTSVILKAMNLCQQELRQIIDEQSEKFDKRFNSVEFNAFLKAGRDRLENYRGVLLNAKRYIKGDPDLQWLPKYLDSTNHTLDNGSRNGANGFDGSNFSFPLKSVHQNPIYATGILHHSCFGNDTFPVELTILDSAAYTFIRLIRELYTRQHMYGTKEIKDLTSIAYKLLDGVKKQKMLFEQLETSLVKLQKSHKNLMTRLQKGRKVSEAAKSESVKKAKAWVAQSREAILANVVGQEMFRYSRLISKPMNLKSYKDEIYSTLRTRALLTNPVFLVVGTFIDCPWHLSAKKIDDFVCKISRARDLPESQSIEGIVANQGALNDKSHVTRRLWVNNNEFISTVTITAETVIPFKPTDVCVNDNPQTPPKDPILDCTVSYSLPDWKLKTTFEKSSRLKMEDIKRIPEVSDDCGTGRKGSMTNALNWIENYDPKIAELCLPFDNSLPILLFPKVFTDYMRLALCPEADKIELMGGIVDLRYSFAKSEVGNNYQLFINVVYGESVQSLKPYQSRCVFEVDSTSVEAFAKDGAEPNLTEFLYSFLFHYSKQHGVPDSTTYVREGLIAPSSLEFPGLYGIFEKFPHLCFTFNHRRYNANTYKSIIQSLNSAALEGYAKLFFTLSKTEVVPEFYMEVQQAIRQKAKALKETDEYKQLEKNYLQFVSLAKLVTNTSVESIRNEVQASARIIPPGEMGWFEQAYYYEPPTDDELKGLLMRLQQSPSLAKERLDIYADELPKIVDSLNSLASGEFVTMDQQKSLAESIIFFNPSKSRADLEEDAKGIVFTKQPEVIHLPKVQKKERDPVLELLRTIKPAALRNNSNSCYVDSLLQILFASSAFATLLKEAHPNKIVYCLRNFHLGLKSRDMDINFLRDQFRASVALNPGQQDADELIRIVFDALGVKGNFNSKRTKIFELGSYTISEEVAENYSLILDVPEVSQSSLQGVLDNFFKEKKDSTDVPNKGALENHDSTDPKNLEAAKNYLEKLELTGQAPPLLSLLLRRERVNGQQNLCKIEVPAGDMVTVMISGKPEKYRVVGIAGGDIGIDRGHWVSTANYGGKWYYINDVGAQVKPIRSPNESLTTDSRLYMLEKVN